MHLSRFNTRFALALVVTALVVLAHERAQVRILQVLTGAGLVVWAVLEIAHAYRQRRHIPGPRGR